jgi:hypothetical protein
MSCQSFRERGRLSLREKLYVDLYPESVDEVPGSQHQAQ